MVKNARIRFTFDRFCEVFEANKIADLSSYRLSIFFNYSGHSINEKYLTTFSLNKFSPLMSAKILIKYFLFKLVR